MERFYNDDDQDNEDKEPFFDSEDDDDYEDDESSEDVVGYIDQQGILDVMQMDLAQTKLNQSLLNKAVDIAKNSWFWSFKKIETRINEIELVYRRLSALTEEVENSIAEQTLKEFKTEREK